MPKRVRKSCLVQAALSLTCGRLHLHCSELDVWSYVARGARSSCASDYLTPHLEGLRECDGDFCPVAVAANFLWISRPRCFVFFYPGTLRICPSGHFKNGVEPALCQAAWRCYETLVHLPRYSRCTPLIFARSFARSHPQVPCE